MKQKSEKKTERPGRDLYAVTSAHRRGGVSLHRYAIRGSELSSATPEVYNAWKRKPVRNAESLVPLHRFWNFNISEPSTPQRRATRA